MEHFQGTANLPIKRCQRGFTLMELLVVAGIIAILAALLLPVLGRAKASTRRIACINNLRQISLGVRMYADDSHDIPAGRGTNSMGDPFSAYKEFLKDYVGIRAISGRSALFACPADSFYFDFETRISQSLHRQSRNSYSSYAFNAGNIPPGVPEGTPPVNPWPGIAGRRLASIREPAKTILVAEYPALLPYSWHQPEGKSHYNNARNVVSFVDGHVSYIKMYWNANNTKVGHQESWHYDPPAGYEYKWSGD
jgi:prepilin-type N-terminal cleavage/methylation domain-containing protein